MVLRRGLGVERLGWAGSVVALMVMAGCGSGSGGPSTVDGTDDALATDAVDGAGGDAGTTSDVSEVLDGDDVELSSDAPETGEQGDGVDCEPGGCDDNNRTDAARGISPVVVDRRARRAKEECECVPVLDRVGDGASKYGVGLDVVTSLLGVEPRLESGHHGAAVFLVIVESLLRGRRLAEESPPAEEPPPEPKK